MKTKTKKFLALAPILIFSAISLTGCSGDSSIQSYLTGTWLCSSNENSEGDANITFEDGSFSYQYINDAKNGNGTWSQEGETFIADGKENEDEPIFDENTNISLPPQVTAGEDYEISLTGANDVFNKREYVSLRVEEEYFLISTAAQVDGTEPFIGDNVQTKCVKQ